MEPEKYIAALDIGTTTIRCFIYDSKVKIVGKSFDQVELLYPRVGLVEIEPDKLWDSIISTIKNAIADANLTAANITCLGISTQRNSFTTWNRKTGKTYHNFCTWKDLRSDKLVKEWNNSIRIKALRLSSHLLYLITRNKRFLAGSVLKMMNPQVTLRLAWELENNDELKNDIIDNKVYYGTIDSWLLYRLRQGNDVTKYVEHISDVTNCCTSGFYDPFTLKWADWAINWFSIDRGILPKVVDNNYDFGHVDESLFGSEIRIGSSISDQSASLWGCCCFNQGDVKITMGTGAFLNLNTAGKCYASVHGLYPLVAYKLTNKSTKEEEVVYCMEGASNDTGSIIKWAVDAGLFSDPFDSAAMAFSVEHSDGVCFVPAFSGFGAPVNDDTAGSGFIGIRPSTKKEHLVRAILESLTFRITLLYICTLRETRYSFTTIKVDGGVSQNDFICQMLADLTGLSVERADSTDSSALGAGFLAGLNTGIWQSREELIKLRKVDKVFIPNVENKEKYLKKMKSWERAVERFKKWYVAEELNSLS